MARNRYTTENRTALKSAISAAPGWNDYRTANGVGHTGNMTIDDLERAADALGIDADAFAMGPRVSPSDYEAAEDGYNADTGPRADAVETDPVTQAVDAVLAGDLPTLPARVRALAERVQDGLKAAQAAQADADTLRAALARAQTARVNSQADAGDDAALVPDVIEPMAMGTAPASKVFGIRSLSGEVMTWAHPMAPRVDPGYIFDRDLLAMTIALINSPTGPAMLWTGGPAGVGKTSFAEQLAARLGLPFHRVNHTRDTEPAALLGQIVPARNGAGVEWRDGVLTQAVRQGGVICLDEPSICPPGTLALYHSLLEANGMGALTLETGERVPLGMDTIVIACDNSSGWGDESGRYAAVQQCNAAFIDRFAFTYALSWLDRAKEAAMIANRAGCTPALAAAMVEFAHHTRSHADKGLITGPVGPRRLINAARLISAGIPGKLAITSAILNQASPEDSETIAQLANVGIPWADLEALAQGREPEPGPAPAATPQGAAAQAEFSGA